MGFLRLAVLGPPEVLHDGSRLTFPLHKAEALLLYLALEKGLHSRGKLAAFLWPDSEPPIARKALRNALALLRHLLADPDASPAQHTHLLGEGDMLGLDSQAPSTWTWTWCNEPGSRSSGSLHPPPRSSVPS